MATDDVGWIKGIRETWRRSAGWPRVSFTFSMIAACLTVAWMLLWVLLLAGGRLRFADLGLLLGYFPILVFAFLGFIWGCAVYCFSDSSEEARALSRLSIIIAVLAGLFPLAIVFLVIA